MCGVSYRYRIVFLSNHKCASTSLEQYLNRNNLIDQHFARMHNHRLMRNKRHTSLNVLTKCYPAWRMFRVLVTVRNPFDRMVSVYNYKSNYVTDTDGTIPDDINQALQTITLNPKHPHNYSPFRSFVPPLPNVVVVRVEDMCKPGKMKETLQKLGVPLKALRTLSDFGHANISKERRATVQDLSKKTRKMIVHYFAHEIKLYYPEIAKEYGLTGK